MGRAFRPRSFRLIPVKVFLKEKYPRNVTLSVKPRSIFRWFQPYEWEASTKEIAMSLGLKPGMILRLDMNTSPFVPRPLLAKLSSKMGDMEVNQYPDTSYWDIRKAVAGYCRTGLDNVVVTNGADEGLDIIVKAFLDKGDRAIISHPTYSMFKVVTEVLGGNCIMVPRKEGFMDDVEGILRKVEKRTKLIFLCSPNNPTGNVSSEDLVAELAESSHAVVVVDEAYFEFSGKSALRLTRRYENLAVVRTFSKAFSMAGIRVGYTMASRNTVSILNKVKPPNSVGTISLKLASLALENLEFMTENVRRIKKERDRCMEVMKEFRNIEVYPSEANFILFGLRGIDGKSLHGRLMKKGLVVRNLSSLQGLENCLRVTIGLPKDNDRFLSALEEIMKNP